MDTSIAVILSLIGGAIVGGAAVALVAAFRRRASVSRETQEASLMESGTLNANYGATEIVLRNNVCVSVADLESCQGTSPLATAILSLPRQEASLALLNKTVNTPHLDLIVPSLTAPMDLDRIARLSSESLVSLLHDLARLQPPTFPHASVYLRFTSEDVPSDASTSPSQPLKPFPSPLADCVARELYARDICEHGGSVDLANARVKVWPKKQKGIEACLRFAATLIDPSRPVPDTEVLAAMNWFAAEAVVAKGCVIQMNPITIRRTLLDMGMIERNDDGSVYTRNKPPQELGLPGVKVPKF